MGGQQGCYIVPGGAFRWRASNTKSWGTFDSHFLRKYIYRKQYEAGWLWPPWVYSTVGSKGPGTSPRAASNHGHGRRYLFLGLLSAANRTRLIDPDPFQGRFTLDGGLMLLGGNGCAIQGPTKHPGRRGCGGNTGSVSRLQRPFQHLEILIRAFHYNWTNKAILLYISFFISFCKIPIQRGKWAARMMDLHRDSEGSCNYLKFIRSPWEERPLHSSQTPLTVACLICPACIDRMDYPMKYIGMQGEQARLIYKRYQIKHGDPLDWCHKCSEW